jgi:hypothetical protein
VQDALRCLKLVKHIGEKVTTLMMIDKLFTKKSDQQNFWNWFSKNANLYFHFEQNQEILFSKLKAELGKVHPGLVFEFSPVFENGTREFVISADGIKNVFPVVTALVKQAPTLKNWKFVAFRQPRTHITHIQYKDLVINLDDVFFRYVKDNGQIGLELNIRGFHECAEWTAAIFILLDNVLGEYHTEMSLSHIAKKGLSKDEAAPMFPIRVLPQVIQDYQSERNN